MKLADVKVGSMVGVIQNPNSSSNRNNPRKVEVLSIVSVPKDRWNGWTHIKTTVNERLVQVQTLTGPGGGFMYGIDRVEKDQVINIPARKIVGLWSDLEPGIIAKAEAETARQERVATLEARLKAVLGVKELGSYVQQQGTAYIFAHEELETILSLAEHARTVDVY